MGKHHNLFFIALFVAVAIGVSSAPGITGRVTSDTEDLSRWARTLRLDLDRQSGDCSVQLIDNLVRDPAWTCDDACAEQSCMFSMTTWSQPVEYPDGRWTEDTSWTQLNDCQQERGEVFQTMADGSSRKKRMFCVCC